jgi:hypothetical protein
LAWETLKSTHEAKTNARKLLLRKELTQLKMGATEPLTKYAARAWDIQTQLRTAGDEVKDQEIAMQLLAGLPPAYGMISTVLTSSDRELNINEMLPKLLQVEQVAQPERPSEAALFAKPKGGFGKNRGNHSQGGNGYNKQPYMGARKCFYCGKPGHCEKQCRKKKSDEASSAYGGQHKQFGATEQKLNLADGSGFVSASATILLVGMYWNATSLRATRWSAKW